MVQQQLRTVLIQAPSIVEVELVTMAVLSVMSTVVPRPYSLLPIVFSKAKSRTELLPKVSVVVSSVTTMLVRLQSRTVCLLVLLLHLMAM